MSEPIVRCAYDELIEISALVPHPKNPNKHSAAQIDRLSTVLQYQGIRKPVIISNQTGFIVTGHGTVQAAKRLGWKMVPISAQDFESLDQEYAHMVADNALQQWSELDLSMVNANLQELGPDIELEMLGLKDFALNLSDKVDQAPPAQDDQTPQEDDGVTKIILFYKNDQYAKVMEKVMEVTSKRGFKDLSECFQALISEESNRLCSQGK